MSNLNGRTVVRVRFRDAVMVGAIHGKAHMSVLHRDGPFPIPMNHKVADEMICTPAGILITFDGEPEKLVAWGNVIEADLEAADASEKRADAPKKEKKGKAAAAHADPRIIAPTEPAATNVRKVENVRQQTPPPKGAA